MTDLSAQRRGAWVRGRRLLDAPHLPIATYLLLVGITTFPGTGIVASTVPTWLACVWSTSLAVGAGLIFWGVAAARTRAESVGHALHLFGLTLLTASTLVEGADGDDVTALAVLAAVSILRMRILTRARRAQRIAEEMLRGTNP